MCVFLTGEADTFGSALSFPRLARDRNPSRRQRDDRHHRIGAETTAAVGQPPHRRALQVKHTPLTRFN